MHGGGTSSAETFQFDKFSVASVVSCSNPLGRARCPHRAEYVYEHRRRCGDTPPYQMEQEQTEQTEMSDPPLCPSETSVVKKEERASTIQTAGFAAKVPLWQCRENVVGRRRFLLISGTEITEEEKNSNG